jgi:hypothetical protein
MRLAILENISSTHVRDPTGEIHTLPVNGSDKIITLEPLGMVMSSN